MSKIGLNRGAFTLIEEGEHVFKITKQLYDEKNGKLTLTCTTKEGQNHIERFSFKRLDGTDNEAAITAFSILARVIMNDDTIDEIDPKLLEGRFFKATINHTKVPKKDNPQEEVTFTNFDRDKEPAECYEDGTVDPKNSSVATSQTSSTPTQPKAKKSLADILG